MKPIEPGALVMIWRARPDHEHAIGMTFVISGPPELDSVACDFCGGMRVFPFEQPADYDCGCPCCLIRIDGDPDAEPVETDEPIEVGV